MELNTNKDDLEKALSNLAETKPAKNNLTESKAADLPPISKQEEIGIHKGSLNTLLAERNELIKMIANVEAIMQAHLARLKELGVDIPVQDASDKARKQ